MHDLLIAHPDELRPSGLDRYAEQLGLDRDRLWDGIRRHVHLPRPGRGVGPPEGPSRLVD